MVWECYEIYDICFSGIYLCLLFRNHWYIATWGLNNKTMNWLKRFHDIETNRLVDVIWGMLCINESFGVCLRLHVHKPYDEPLNNQYWRAFIWGHHQPSVVTFIIPWWSLKSDQSLHMWPNFKQTIHQRSKIQTYPKIWKDLNLPVTLPFVPAIQTVQVFSVHRQPVFFFQESNQSVTDQIGVALLIFAVWNAPPKKRSKITGNLWGGGFISTFTWHLKGKLNTMQTESWIRLVTWKKMWITMVERLVA